MLNPFWSFFEATAAPQLAHRESTFRQLFSYLDKLADPLVIVETGSVRQPGNWRGDGQSTLLFDRYAQQRPGTRVLTVDSDAEASRQCLGLVSGLVEVHTRDSVAFLHTLAQHPWPDPSWCFYLDSFDVDYAAPYPSAAHHLKELVAIAPLLRPDSLVVIDDSPASPPGKGFLVAEYAQAIGARVMFHEYQLGLTQLR